jgi:hypothetical protein
MSNCISRASSCAFFSEGHNGSPVSSTLRGECKAIGVLEVCHRSQYGHFVSYGLHADVTVSEGDTGIPGITQLIDAHLTNFGLFPETVDRCEFVSDAGAHGVSVGYRLEQ